MKQREGIKRKKKRMRNSCEGKRKKVYWRMIK
jgi:hypothetical protein